MKNVLCFGDSNTWGWNPELHRRFERHLRWPGLLQSLMGADYYIIEEGLSGRTTVFDDPIEAGRNGSSYLPACLLTHQPLDLVILVLGTNDVKSRFGVSAFEIAEGMASLVKIVLNSGAGREGKPPPILLVAPPPLAEIPAPYDEMFIDSHPKSRRLAHFYQEVATLYGCAFWDSAARVKVGSDGIHWDEANHRHMAEAISEQILTFFTTK